MTEEIIIDGIDISECEFANACNKKMKCVILQDDVCETNPYCEGYNCYYKQLKRLEQENKELKSDVLKWQKAFSRQYQINENKGYSKTEENYRSALEEIEKILNDAYRTGRRTLALAKIRDKINEVLK